MQMQETIIIMYWKIDGMNFKDWQLCVSSYKIKLN